MQQALDRKVIAGFGVALGILIVLGAIQYAAAQRLIRDNRWVAHAQQVLLELDRTLNLLADGEMAVRAYVSAGGESYLDSWGRAAAGASVHLQNLRNLGSDNVTQQHRLAKLEPLMGKSLRLLQQAVDPPKDANISSARQIIFGGVGRKLLDDTRALIGEMKDEEFSLLRKRNEAAETNNRRTTAIILMGSSIAMLLLTVAGVLMHFDTGKRSRAEQKLARETHLLHILMDNVPDFIYFKDAASRFTKINWALATALGMPRPEHAVGKTDFDFFCS